MKEFFKNLFGKKEERNIIASAGEILSPVSGKVVPLESLSDATFAEKILGDGLAVEPSEGVVYAPFNGTVDTVMDTGHAVCLVSDDGMEVLIHVGQDTVQLKGKNFKVLVSEGDKVKAGQQLLKFDMAAIKAAGYPLTTPVILTNGDDYQMAKTDKSDVIYGENLLNCTRK